MKQSNNNQSVWANKKGKTMITSNHQNEITTNILCGILTVKLNHDITRNLMNDLICEVVSYTYKFKHQLNIHQLSEYINKIDKH